MVLDILTDALPAVVEALQNRASAHVTSALTLRSWGVAAGAVEPEAAVPVSTAAVQSPIAFVEVAAEEPDGGVVHAAAATGGDNASSPATLGTASSMNGELTGEDGVPGSDPTASGSTGPRQQQTPPELPGQYIIKGGDTRVDASGVETAAGPQLVEYKAREGCLQC